MSYGNNMLENISRRDIQDIGQNAIFALNKAKKFITQKSCAFVQTVEYMPTLSKSVDFWLSYGQNPRKM